MPISYTIKSDGKLEFITKNIAEMPRWMPAIIRTHMDHLGEVGEDRMKAAVADNRYTGSLEESIHHRSEDAGLTTVIEPTVKRGKWDGGLILEHGTGPIPNAPWGPIKAWAAFRGIPGWPVLYTIRTRGVKAHPFLDRTLTSMQSDIEEAARRIADEVARTALFGGGTNSA